MNNGPLHWSFQVLVHEIGSHFWLHLAAWENKAEDLCRSVEVVQSCSGPSRGGAKEQGWGLEEELEETLSWCVGNKTSQDSRTNIEK